MKKVGVFLGITFTITWILSFGLMFNGGYSNPNTVIVLSICMLVPAISVIITTIITKGSFKNDIWIKPNLKGNIKYYLIAWFGPALLIVFGAIIYYLIFPNQFDGSMTNIINTTKEQLVAKGQNVLSDNQIKSMLISQVFIGILLAPILNFITCLGEELGWRGFLLPNLCKKYSPLTATIITGVIWGIWHAPMIAMGHNYGLNYKGAPWGGIFAMILFCTFVGAFLSYITIKVKSSVPAILAHGMINGLASVSIMFLAVPTVNSFIGPLPVGIVGGFGFVLAGGYCLFKIYKLKEE